MRLLGKIILQCTFLREFALEEENPRKVILNWSCR